MLSRRTGAVGIVMSNDTNNKSFWGLAAGGKLRALESLYSHRHQFIDVNWRNPHYDGATGLIRAAWGNKVKMVIWLLEHTPADVNAKDDGGFTALHFAAKYGHDSLIRLLLAHGAMIDEQTKDGDSSLIWASKMGRETSVQLLLENHANVHAKNNQNETSLYWAVSNKFEKIWRALIDKGADINVKTIQGTTCLLLACVLGDLALVRELLERGATSGINVQDEDGDTPLICAAINGQMELIPLLLDHGADLRIKNNRGHTAFLKCAANGCTETLQVLVDHGANKDDLTDDGRTALMLAAQGGYERTVKRLLALSGDHGINIQDNEGNTALIHGAESWSRDIVQAVLDKKADPQVRNKNDSTVFDLANGSIKEFIISFAPTAKDHRDLWVRITDSQREAYGELWRQAGASFEGRLESATVLTWLTQAFGVTSINAEDILQCAQTSGDYLNLYSFVAVMRGVALVQEGAPIERKDIMNVHKRLIPNFTPMDLSHSKRFFHLATYGKLEQLKDLYEHHIDDILINWRNPSWYDGHALIGAVIMADHRTMSWLLENTDIDRKAKNLNGNNALHCGCHNDQVTRILLAAGFDINERNAMGETPVIRAAKWNSDKALKLLLEHSADINVRDNEGKTALDRAELSGKLSCVELIRHHMILSDGQSSSLFHHYAGVGSLTELSQLYQEHGSQINVNWKDSENDGLTPLMRAAVGGFHEIVLWLIETAKASVSIRDENGRTALHLAAALGRDLVVQILLDHGKRVINNTCCYDNTPLIAAAENGHDKVVQMLLDHGANPSVRNWSGRTAWDEAVRNDKFSSVSILLNQVLEKHGKEHELSRAALNLLMHSYAVMGKLDLMKQACEQNKEVIDLEWKNPDDEHTSCLQAAAMNGYQEVIQWLLQNGAKLDARTPSGATAAVLAARYGNGLALQALIESGASANDQDDNGRTVLMEVASLDDENMVQFVLDRGADIHAKNNHQETALLMTAKCGYYNTAKLLLDRGANVLERDKNGETALLWAVSASSKPLVELLLSHGANVRDVDEDGDSVLTVAAKFGCEELLKLLLTLDVDLNHQNNAGYSPLLAATESQSLDMVKALLLHPDVDVSIRNVRGESVLHMVVMGRQVRKLLPKCLELGSNPYARTQVGSTALQMAANAHSMYAKRHLLACESRGVAFDFISFV